MNGEATSAEQLDALLEQGKISQEDYDRLREAMDQGEAKEAERGKAVPPGMGQLRTGQGLAGGDRGVPWVFGTMVVILWIVHIFVNARLAPRVMLIFEEMGAELPAFTRIAIGFGQFTSRSIIGVMAQFMLLVSLVGFYVLVMPFKPARGILFALVVVGFGLLLLLYIVAYALPFFKMAEILQ